MGAPIRSSTEIDQIITRGQHTIGDIGLDLVNDFKTGLEITDVNVREKVYRLELLRISLQNLLTPDLEIKAYYQDPANEKKLNKVLDVIAKLSKSFDQTSLPILGQKRIPLYFYPSSSGTQVNAGGGPATPGGITFQNNQVDSPGELVDSFNASDSEFAFYIYSVRGSGIGEGSRSGILILSWRGTDVKIAGDLQTDDTGGGNTDGVSFSAAIVSGYVQLTCNVPTDGWVCKGTRILFQNISFQNPIGPLPPGGTTNQLLRKVSNNDYETEWFTLLWQHITDSGVSLAELQTLIGISTSQSIQTQFNNLVSSLASEASSRASADSTLQTNINNEASTRSSADTTLQNNINSEASTRASADANLQSQIDAIGNPVSKINIGDWNMNYSAGGDSLKIVSLGIDFSKVINTRVTIISDANEQTDFLADNFPGVASSSGGYFTVTKKTLTLEAEITMQLPNPCVFNNTKFDATLFNRGYILVTHTS